MVKHKSRCHVSANGTVIESVFWIILGLALLWRKIGSFGS
jgi:hypothetical protein